MRDPAQAVDGRSAREICERCPGSPRRIQVPSPRQKRGQFTAKKSMVTHICVPLGRFAFRGRTDDGVWNGEQPHATCLRIRSAGARQR